MFKIIENYYSSNINSHNQGVKIPTKRKPKKKVSHSKINPTTATLLRNFSAEMDGILDRLTKEKPTQKIEVLRDFRPSRYYLREE